MVHLAESRTRHRYKNEFRSEMNMALTFGTLCRTVSWDDISVNGPTRDCLDETFFSPVSVKVLCRPPSIYQYDMAPRISGQLLFR